MARRSTLPPEVDQRAEALVQNVLLTGLTPQELRNASDPQLLTLQTQLCMGSLWGFWEVPAEFMPRHKRRKCHRTYRLELALPKGFDLESDASRCVWRELLRLVIAMRIWPAKSGVRLKYSSAQWVLRMAGGLTQSVVNQTSEGFWSRVSVDQASALIGKYGPTCCNTIIHFHKMGCLADAPQGRNKPNGTEGPRDRTGEPEHTSRIDETEQYQALPDAYIVEAGWRVIKMIRLIGPALLDALEHTAERSVRTTNADPRHPNFGLPLSQDQQWNVRARALNPGIAAWRWTAPDGSLLKALDFGFNIGVRGGGRVHWPPKTFAQAWGLLTLLQACHLWPVALAMAGRHGELLSLTEGSLREETNHPDRVGFTTWKLEPVGGRERELPVPSLVAEAIAQQERLARLVKQLHGASGNHLWVQTSVQPGLPLEDFTNSLNRLTEAFSLEPLLEGTRAHMHRFRKTLARIVALALVHAPKILMDIFGHRDEQMTVLRYILADPGILNEIQSLVQEIVILKGVEAVNRRDEVQGGGAPLLRERVDAYSRRLGAKAMEPQNLMEFVRAMTENGSNWAVIGPGIICTSFKNGGLCNKGQGQANPHYCDPGCSNQLVMPDFDNGAQVASAVTHAIESIDYALDALRQANVDGDEMLMAQFAGQVRSLLNRWKQVDQHFANNPLLRLHIPNVVLLT